MHFIHGQGNVQSAEKLPNGIPSHDTLSDVIGRINRDAFAQAFSDWGQASLPELAGHQVAINGKSLRGSRGEDGTVHVISAFVTQARLVLAAKVIPDNSLHVPLTLHLLLHRFQRLQILSIGSQRIGATTVRIKGVITLVGEGLHLLGTNMSCVLQDRPIIEFQQAVHICPPVI